MTFETRSAELAKAATEIYRRYPAPAEAIRSLGNARPSSEAIAVVSAMAVTGASAMPGFQHLVHACRVSAASGKNLSRRDDCGATGRLLMLHSDTLIASRIGMTVLRVSKTYDESDLRAARDLDWIYDQYLSTVPTDDGAPALEWATTYQRDWIDTGRETEAMRRAVIGAGIASAPPDDWIDGKSVFSQERQRLDEAALEHAARPR